jgi:hypothetical protein
MTTRNTLPKREGGAVFTEAHARQLLGIREQPADFMEPPYGKNPENDQNLTQLMRRHWREHRSKLLPAWIAERPGTRPRSWWLFDAPLNLRRIFVDGKEFEPARRRYQNRAEWIQSTYYGAHKCIGGPGVENDLATFTPPDDVEEWTEEPERDYLARHRLLTAGE